MCKNITQHFDENIAPLSATSCSPFACFCAPVGGLPDMMSALHAGGHGKVDKARRLHEFYSDPMKGASYKSDPNADKGEGGQKIRKFCRLHIWSPPRSGYGRGRRDRDRFNFRSEVGSIKREREREDLDAASAIERLTDGWSRKSCSHWRAGLRGIPSLHIQRHLDSVPALLFHGVKQ